MVKLLLKHGADVALFINNGQILLYSTINKGYINIIKLLLKSSADITILNNTK